MAAPVAGAGRDPASEAAPGVGRLQEEALRRKERLRALRDRTLKVNPGGPAGPQYGGGGL